MSRLSVTSFEILAVILTAAGKFVFIDWLNQKFWYVSMACLGWLIYVLRQLKKNPKKVRQWGFGKRGFRPSLRYLFPFAAVSLAIFIVYGFWSGRAVIHWHIIPILILYPLWGTIQHFLLIALVAGNLNRMDTPKLSHWSIVLFTATLFSLVHYPSYGLMGATFLLAALYVNTYIKFENLWALGLIHGWLGACFYYLVLGRDTWVEFVAAVQ